MVKKGVKSKKGDAEKLHESLHDAEMRQLETFLKNRKNTVDNEIESLRKKLTGADMPEIQSITTQSGGGLRGLNGTSLNKGNIRNLDDTYRSAMGISNSNTRNPIKNDTLTAMENDQNEKLHKNLLLRLKSSAMDRELSNAEVYHLLISPSTCGPEIDSLPLDEVVENIQLDLQTGVTVDDQRILVQYYSTDAGEIHIPSLLSAAGLMPNDGELEALGDPLSPYGNKQNSMKPNLVDLQEDNLVTLGTGSIDWDANSMTMLNETTGSPVGKLMNDPSKSQQALTNSMYGNIVHRSRNNVDSLANMHTQINSSMEGTGLPDATLSDNKLMANLQQRKQDTDALKMVTDNMTYDINALPPPVQPPKPVSQMTNEEIDNIGRETTGAAAEFLVNGKVDMLVDDMRISSGGDELLPPTTTISPATREARTTISRALTSSIENITGQPYTTTNANSNTNERLPDQSDIPSSQYPANTPQSQSERDRLLLENLRLKKII